MDNEVTNEPIVSIKRENTLNKIKSVVYISGAIIVVIFIASLSFLTVRGNVAVRDVSTIHVYTTQDLEMFLENIKYANQLQWQVVQDTRQFFAIFVSLISVMFGLFVYLLNRKVETSEEGYKEAARKIEEIENSVKTIANNAIKTCEEKTKEIENIENEAKTTLDELKSNVVQAINVIEKTEEKTKEIENIENEAKTTLDELKNKVAQAINVIEKTNNSNTILNSALDKLEKQSNELAKIIEEKRKTADVVKELSEFRLVAGEKIKNISEKLQEEIESRIKKESEVAGVGVTANEIILRAIKNKNFKIKEMLFNKAIEQEPDSAKAYILRGNMYFENKNYSSAIDDYKIAVTLDDNNPDILNNKAASHIYIANQYLLDNQEEKAMIEYRNAFNDTENAIKINSKYFEAYINQSISNCGMKKFEEALINLKEADEIKPEQAVTYDAYAAIYCEYGCYLKNKGEIEKAKEMFDKVTQYCKMTLEADSFANGAYVNLACMYVCNESIEEAYLSLEKAVSFGYEDTEWIQKTQDIQRLREINKERYDNIVNGVFKNKDRIDRIVMEYEKRNI